MDADKLANWLLEQDPSQALQYLHERLEGIRQLPDGFAWRGVAECAASDTFPSSARPNLGWANVAVLAYNHVIAEEKRSKRLISDSEKKKMSYLSLELAVMRVQAGCIRHFGHVTGDPVLDGNHLIKSFFEGLTFSPEKAREKGVQKRSERTLREHMEWVRIREKLKILRPLAKKHLLPENSELKAWFSVLDEIDQGKI